IDAHGRRRPALADATVSFLTAWSSRNIASVWAWLIGWRSDSGDGHVAKACPETPVQVRFARRGSRDPSDSVTLVPVTGHVRRPIRFPDSAQNGLFRPRDCY